MKLGLKVILTDVTLITSSATVLAEETIANNYSGINQETVTVIHHDKDDLTSDQLGQIVSGMPEISSLV